MTTTQPTTQTKLPEVSATLPGPADPGLKAEWLLTNGLGGYAMSTPAGINTRRYHGLLVAALTPPVNRFVALNAVADTVTLDPNSAHQYALTLTGFRFAGASDSPTTTPAPCVFRRGLDCSWVYTFAAPAGEVRITKSLHLFDRRNAIALTYRIDAPGVVRLALRPLTALRDFHHLAAGEQIANGYQARPVKGGVMCATRSAGLHIVCYEATYIQDPDIWHDIEYARDAQRGQTNVEDLFSPGEFIIEADRSIETTLYASVDAAQPQAIEPDKKARAARVRTHIDTAISNAPAASQADKESIARLTLAAEDFIVKRGSAQVGSVSVIAGYPWFADWGRDTMISLPGLLLCTGRYQEALSALKIFAKHRRGGLIPNRFDDREGPAHYNTVDASLWYLVAAAQYRQAADDHDGYTEYLAPACNDIIDAYRVGTDFGIGMDTDGLIAAGNPQTQLTWMDAQREGVTFTPRYGKAVEINALWHHGLIVTADAIEDESPRRAAEQRAIAELARESFVSVFFRPDGLGLFDRLEPVEGDGWIASPEIRPNQLFAASLASGPLDRDQRRMIVDVVRDRLLTPAGVRTLDPGDEEYTGRYAGDMFTRDRSYHNGTVWPWLLGPYAEAVLRAGGFDAASRTEARASLGGLLGTLASEGLGQLPEIYDGDDSPAEPRAADGCPAQAWSIAETLRALTMLNQGH